MNLGAGGEILKSTFFLSKNIQATVMFNSDWPHKYEREYIEEENRKDEQLQLHNQPGRSHKYRLVTIDDVRSTVTENYLSGSHTMILPTKIER